MFFVTGATVVTQNPKLNFQSVRNCMIFMRLVSNVFPFCKRQETKTKKQKARIFMGRFY